jgi:hypothetical protein
MPTSTSPAPPRDPRAALDRALSADLLSALAAARRKRDHADAQIRLLLAYGLHFTTPTRRPSLTSLARVAGVSRNTLRAHRACTPADITRLALLLGRAPRAKDGA